MATKAILLFDRDTSGTPVQARRLTPKEQQRALALARAIYRSRRRREEILGKSLFAEPAWDILLHLYVATGKQQPVCVSAACAAAVVPFTTGLRWIQQLEKEGMILREIDPDDARRSYLQLSAPAVIKMETLLREMLEAGC